MKIILLSGGSGTRLWPLSNEARSKQFLKILKNEKGQKQSMVQRVYSQLSKTGHAEEIVVATNANQADAIKAQLGEDVEIVIEPERRNTWPAIALSVAHLYYHKKSSYDDVVVVLPIDPFAEDHYFELLSNLEMVVKEGADIALMGVTPTYPSEKYGYIVPKNNEKNEQNISYYKVSHFKEKPTETEAETLIQTQNALWNCGVFAFKIGYVMAILKQFITCDSYEAVFNHYNALEKTSFDYAIVEKASNIAVLEYTGIWKDLGTWNTLSEHVTEPAHGNVVMSETCENTHIINELEIPTVVVGVSNVVVVATHDGILVSDKHESSYLKNYIEDKMTRPMYEKRRWGKYTVYENSNHDDGQQVMTKKLEIYAGKNISYQYHEHRSEVWTIVEGHGFFVKNNKLYTAKPGDVFKINVGDRHGIRATENLTMIEVQLGTNLVEDDIIRIEKNWDRILECCDIPSYTE
ncbi:MAG: sugar phosphate nucleotidyltransferase [Eubacterium sp.]